MATPRSESESRSRSDDDTWESSTAFEGTTSSYDNASEESSQIAVDEKIPISPGQAAAIIQGMYRRMNARNYFVERVRQAYEKVYDEENDGYFYYSNLNGTSQWVTPRTLLGRSLDPKEEPAAAKLQCFVRGSCARKKVMRILNDVYEKEYDPDTDSWFYVNKMTMTTTWEKPVLFGKGEPPTNTSDAALLNKEREIEELQQELAKRTSEAEEAKKALEDKIIEEKVKNKELDPDEAKGRSRHMDEWDVGAVVEWFHAVGYTQYDESIKEHQVDGLLLLHLMNEDWGHLGITSPLIVRRLDVAMQKYRVRFERKQANGGEETGDASDASSASDTPSDLLDEDDPYDDEDSDYEEEEDQNASAGQDILDQEEVDELQRDKEHISKEIIFEGDEERGRPVVGDIARIHYTCALQGGNGSSTRIGGGSGRKGSRGTDGIVVESSRKNRRRPLEFVVGGGQVVKGIDRVIRTMLFGERARVTITALYGYGYKGHPPTIPPDSALSFDINLLEFRPRPRWRKPLVQVLSEPYTEEPYAPRLLAPVGDMGSNNSGRGDGGGGGGGGGWDDGRPADNLSRK